MGPVGTRCRLDSPKNTMKPELFELIQLCAILSKKAPMAVLAQSALYDALLIVVHEETRPGFLDANREAFEQCRDTLKALTS